jgi:hypothetical protein
VLAGETFAPPADDVLVIAGIDDTRLALTASGTNQVAAPAVVWTTICSGPGLVYYDLPNLSCRR